MLAAFRRVGGRVFESWDSMIGCEDMVIKEVRFVLAGMFLS